MSFPAIPNDPGLFAPSVAVNALNYGAKGDGVTDDSGGVQAAIDAAAAKSANLSGIPVDVWLPPGYGFLLGQITPKAGARLWCYGAVIIPGTLGLNGMFTVPDNLGAFPNSGILGGYWAGTGNESSNQFLWRTGTGTGLVDCVFADMQIPAWGVGPLYLRNPTRVKVLRNTMLNVGSLITNTARYNSINLVFEGGVAAAGKLIVAHNIIDGSGADSIAVVVTGAGVSGPLPTIIAENVVAGLSANGSPNSGAIVVEVDAATTISEVTVASNDVTAWANNGCIQFASGGSGGHVQQCRAIGNRVTNNGTGQGIGVYDATSEVDAQNNRITAPTPFTGTFALKTGNRISLGPSQGRAVLVAGTVTVNTAEIQAGDNVILTVVVPGGTRGEIQLGTIVAGTSFVINSIQPGTASTVQTLDTSTVYWRIDH